MAVDPLSPPESLRDGYTATFTRLRRMFRARGMSAHDADDLAQETALRTLRFLRDRIIDERDITPLVNRIASNLFIDTLRTSKKIVALDDADELSEPGSDPAESLDQRERRSIVLSAAADLPARQRRAIELYLDGVDHARIAETLGMRRNAVDALLHRARKGMAGRLREVREEAGALGVIGWIRFRLGSKRVHDAPVIAMTSPAMLNIATAAIAAVATLGGAAAPARATPAPRAPVAVVAAVAERERLPVTPRSSMDEGSRAPSNRRYTRLSVEPRKAIHGSLRPREARVLGLEVWHADEETEGRTGEVYGEAVRNACATPAGPRACSKD